MSQLQFNASLYARPDKLVPGSSFELRGQTVETLKSDQPQVIFDQFLPVTFEQAMQAMQQLAQMDAEPDGFFVFSGMASGQRWQLDGHLYDFNNRLHRVLLSGSCPEGSLDQLLKCYGWPTAELVFELTHEGQLLEESQLRRWAARLTN